MGPPRRRQQGRRICHVFRRDGRGRSRRCQPAGRRGLAHHPVRGRGSWQQNIKHGRPTAVRAARLDREDGGMAAKNPRGCRPSSHVDPRVPPPSLGLHFEGTLLRAQYCLSSSGRSRERAAVLTGFAAASTVKLTLVQLLLQVAEAASLCQKLPPGTVDALEEPVSERWKSSPPARGFASSGGLPVATISIRISLRAIRAAGYNACHLRSSNATCYCAYIWPFVAPDVRSTECGLRSLSDTRRDS